LDHLLSKDNLGNLGLRRSGSRTKVRSSSRPFAGQPSEQLGSTSIRPHRHHSALLGNDGKPAGFPWGFSDAIRIHFGRMRSTVPCWLRVGAVILTTSPPGQTRNDQSDGPSFQADRAAGRCFLAIRWLVTHESHTRVRWSGSNFVRSVSITREGEWQLSTTVQYETASPDVMSRGAVSKNPYG